MGIKLSKWKFFPCGGVWFGKNIVVLVRQLTPTPMNFYLYSDHKIFEVNFEIARHWNKYESVRNSFDMIWERLPQLVYAETTQHAKAVVRALHEGIHIVNKKGKPVNAIATQDAYEGGRSTRKVRALQYIGDETIVFWWRYDAKGKETELFQSVVTGDNEQSFHALPDAEDQRKWLILYTGDKIQTDAPIYVLKPLPRR
jgi:hypothetical protein